MIRNEPFHGSLTRAPHALPTREPRVSVWQRFAAWWTRGWGRSPFELEVEARVQRYLGHKPWEPGDVVMVNEIIEEVSRRRPSW